MTDLRKAAEMALEAWEKPFGERGQAVEDAIEELRQALAQPEQETRVFDRGCWERGCIAYDDRDGDGVVVQASVKEKNGYV